MSPNPFARFARKNGTDVPPRGPEATPSVEFLQQEVERLQRAVDELSILNDLALTIGSSVDSQEMIQKLVDRLMRAVNAEQAVVTLVDTNSVDPMKTNVRVMTGSDTPIYRLNEAFLGWMYLNKKPLVLNDPSNDERFKGLKWDETIRSLACVPLLLKSELMGMLTVFNKKSDGGFSAEDQRLLPIIAAQSAQILENARLSKQSASMQEQVRLASVIQNKLLPHSPPVIDGYDIAGKSVPAQEVGGDYFDFIATTGDRYAVCLGDVSGKGLPASLIMANMQATLRAQAMTDATASECIERSNTLMYRSLDDERFVTLFYSVLDVSTHELTFCNAGHENPFVFTGRGPEPDRLETSGIALGVLDNRTYSERTIGLEPGDVLVVFSDGITDATNKAGELFGYERLQSVVAANRNEPAAVLVSKIIDTVNDHVNGAPQVDDLTLVVVKRTG